MNSRNGKTRCINGRLPGRCQTCCEGVDDTSIDEPTTGGEDIDDALDEIPSILPDRHNAKKEAKEALKSLAPSSSSSSNKFTLCFDQMHYMVDKTADALGFYDGGEHCIRGKIGLVFIPPLPLLVPVLYGTTLHDHCVCPVPPVFNGSYIDLWGVQMLNLISL